MSVSACFFLYASIIFLFKFFILCEWCVKPHNIQSHVEEYTIYCGKRFYHRLKMEVCYQHVVLVHIYFIVYQDQWVSLLFSLLLLRYTLEQSKECTVCWFLSPANYYIQRDTRKNILRNMFKKNNNNNNIKKDFIDSLGQDRPTLGQTYIHMFIFGILYMLNVLVL